MPTSWRRGATCCPESRSPHSPEGRLWISKPYFDPVLQAHAKSLAQVEVRYQTSFESFEQNAQTVLAEVLDKKTGRNETISADYLVGCDGGRSNIRRALAIKFQGVFSQGMNVAVLFRSALLRHIKFGPAVQYQIINSQINGAIAAVDGKELWRLNVRNIKQAMSEVSRYYVELRKLGLGVTHVDVGGGLGVDYDGSRSTRPASVNYTMREYASDVIYTIGTACRTEELPMPHIISESGRALVAHHSVLVFNVLGVQVH